MDIRNVDGGNLLKSWNQEHIYRQKSNQEMLPQTSTLKMYDISLVARERLTDVNENHYEVWYDRWKD
jgi:hypothetical protein